MANQNEFGQTLYFNVNYDMSTNTALALVLTDPGGTALSKTPTLEAAATTVTLPDGTSKTYAANEHVSFVMTDGDLGAADKGEWTAVLTATFGSTARLTATDRFEVGE